ncbi:MAG: hypothetical protein HY225_02295 [Candidatus Vogelbacteria bacterium]|nr:hypothetical protein [Candidatus Vogelbacteria bacterium]
MIPTNLMIGVFAQQAGIMVLFVISGYIAFSGLADHIRAAKLPREAKSARDAVHQVASIITWFVTILSGTYAAMCLGLNLRILMLILCFLSTEKFTQDLLVQTKVNKFISKIGSIFLSAVLSYGWYVHPNRITIDTMAILMATQFLVTYRNITLKQSFVLSLGIMGYDALMVFGAGLMQKVVAGATIGGKVLIPVLVMIPKTLSIDSDYQFMLGLGDIVIPGFIVICALRLAVRYRKSSLVIGAWLGYVAGSIAALSMLFIFKFPQPATIYLIPGAFAGLLAAAWYESLVNKILFTKEV